jgi:AraC-like DNA-binding protein
MLHLPICRVTQTLNPRCRSKSKSGGLRAARLQAIRAEIRASLDGDHSTSALASRHNVSTRYIRKMFETEGTTVAQFVLVLRLEQVHRRLSDPRHDHRTIAEIAYEAGFGDISTFNRAFRARYDMTPGEICGEFRNDGTKPTTNDQRPLIFRSPTDFL